MADSYEPLVTRWGDELRRFIAGRRRWRDRLIIAALAGCTAVPLAASALWKPATLLVWNASASAPLGLYRLNADAPARGDMVIAWTPEPARSLAARRHYLPANVPLVKLVAAVAGDEVCAVGSGILINGKLVATRQGSDALGRSMPWWSGCRQLRDGEYFLLMDHPQSFDGRYFGVTQIDHVVGRAELLWAKPAQGSNDG